MNSITSFSALLALIFCIGSLNYATAFRVSVDPPVALMQRRTRSRIFSWNSLSAHTDETASDVPSWSDMPRAHLTQSNRNLLSDDKQQTSSSLPSAEIFFGRIAMVGVLGLFAVEISTGKSLPEQFLCAMNIIV